MFVDSDIVFFSQFTTFLLIAFFSKLPTKSLLSAVVEMVLFPRRLSGLKNDQSVSATSFTSLPVKRAFYFASALCSEKRSALQKARTGLEKNKSM